MAENFDKFKNHKREFKYLGNVTAVQLGNGYSYISKPIAPQLKEFTLSFSGYRFYFDEEGRLDYETNKELNNMGTLCQFYEEMNQYTTFVYNDEQFGAVPVRFKEPLTVPKTTGDRGFVEDFTITLVEVSE